jgi:hypothetical protein
MHDAGWPLHSNYFDFFLLQDTEGTPPKQLLQQPPVVQGSGPESLPNAGLSKSTKYSAQVKAVTEAPACLLLMEFRLGSA